MRFLVRTISLLPLSLLYFIADYIVYPIIYYIVRYRRRVVSENLLYSFPDKILKERKRIEKEFYHFFSALLLETIKGYRIDHEQMKDHFEIYGHEKMIEDAKTHGGIILMLGHICTWEWLAEIGYYTNQGGVESAYVYHHLNNKKADDLMLEIRKKRGGDCVEMRGLLRYIIKMKNEQKPCIYCLLADQKPSPDVELFETTFLNQRTTFFSGGDKLSRKFGYPVYFAHSAMRGRGHYVLTLQPMVADANSLPINEVTKIYATTLEKNILEFPAYWLWSHNRWKWTRNKQETQSKK